LPNDAVELAELFDYFATAPAAFAVFAGLYIAITGSSDPKVAQVPRATLFLVLFGLAVFMFGRAVRYHFVGAELFMWGVAVIGLRFGGRLTTLLLAALSVQEIGALGTDLIVAK
jgi:hypothetical protein